MIFFTGRLEIGIRLALGADPGGIFRMILARALRLTAIGVVLGAVAFFPLQRLSTAIIFGTVSANAYAFAGPASILIAIAIAASAFPGLRAMRIDANAALREE